MEFCVVHKLPHHHASSLLNEETQLPFTRPSGQQIRQSDGICQEIHGLKCVAYVGAAEEIICIVCVSITEGAY